MQSVMKPGASHKQEMSNMVWTVNHNLGRHVIVDVFINFQGELQKILPKSVIVVDLNTIKVVFSRPQTGIVRVI